MYDAHHAYHHRVQQCSPHAFPVLSATCCTISDDDAATSSERCSPRLRRRSRTTRADGSHIAGRSRVWGSYQWSYKRCCVVILNPRRYKVSCTISTFNCVGSG
jgi:hypothetical protein